MSTTPQKPEGGALSRFKSFRSPTRAFTLTSPARPASPTTTGPNGRPTPSRSSTRDSSTAKSRSSILTSPFRKARPSTDAVNELGVKSDEPVEVATTEAATTEAATTEAKPEPTSDHIRARSGSTISTRSSQLGPLTPLPAQTTEPITIPTKDADPTDSPHEAASVASSRSPSRLRRRVSSLSRHSISGSIRRLSLLGAGATSPPQVETTPAIGEMETRSRSPSISSARRLAMNSDPAAATSPQPSEVVQSSEPVQTPEPVIAKSPEPTSESPVPQAEIAPQAEPPAPQADVIPQVEAPVSQLEAPAPPTEESQVAPAPTEAPVQVAASEVPAPAETQEAPRPAEPQTPVKPSMSRNASTTSLTKSPAEKPEPKRRSTLTNWARRSLDRKASGSGPGLARPPSRGALSGDESDADSVKERERGWNTGRPVPEPKKSDENLKRRFGLGRRASGSGHAKTPSESASESEKKSNWAAKVLRVGSKSKKDKSEAGSLAATSTNDLSTVDAVPEPVIIPDLRPSLAIPDNMAMDPRPLSAIVESPVVPLAQAWGDMHLPAPAAVVSSPLANTVVAESPVEANPQEVVPEPEVVEAPAEVVESKPVAPAQDTAALVDAVPVESAPTEDAELAPAPASGTATPARVETADLASPPQNLLSPISPNSPSSTPWDPIAQREIARARSPRRASAGGPSNRSRLPSPAASIIGVKRKQPDEPDASKGRIRYLPNWAISPAIQLALTLSVVLPRRRRDAANPASRRRGWWPFKRSGPRTELRYNAIRGVNEEVPIVSRSWTVPAAVRTTVKVATAPARWMFRMFVPRSNAN